METTREKKSGGGGTATTEVATLHCSKLSSDYFALTRRGRDFLLLLPPPLPPSSSSSWSSLLTRGSLILSSLLCLTCLPTRPRPQFPPILFSKQVCKTQFSRRLTSHLIARWSTISPLLLFLFILPTIVAFIFFLFVYRVSFFSYTNNSISLLHSRRQSRFHDGDLTRAKALKRLTREEIRMNILSNIGNFLILIIYLSYIIREKILWIFLIIFSCLY